jgi:ABC-type Fe3+/spermidine/putrescine transport system ATPase subunit
MLSITSLNQYYGSSHTLRDVSLAVAQGACTVVLGRNGVGKTTLLKCLVGLLPAKTGDITLDGHTITRTASHKRVAAGLGYVPQGRDIFPLLTVEENLRIGAYAGERHASLHGKQFSFDDVFRTFPILKPPHRRQSVRRSATAAGDRPRAADQSEAADSRRTDRRHPAVDRDGNRSGDPLAEGLAIDPARRAVFRFRPGGRRRLCRAGTRPGGIGRPRRPDGGKRRQVADLGMTAHPLRHAPLATSPTGTAR